MNQKSGLSPQSNTSEKRWLYLGIFITLFIGPMIVALTLYFDREYLPESLNHGHLIQPPLLLPQLAMISKEGARLKWREFKGRWIMLYIAPKKCNNLCSKSLYKMRQIRLALGKNRVRVQRVVLTLRGESDKNLENYMAKNDQDKSDQGIMHLKVERESLIAFLKQLPSHKKALSEGYLYLADPLGHLIMSYKLEESPKAIYDDLTRLLTVSQIG